MAEHFLYCDQVGATLEQVRGERVAERMRTDGFVDAGGRRMSVEYLPYPHPAQRLPSGVEEHPAEPPALFQSGSQIAQIEGKCSHRSPAERHEPLLSSLAEHE